MTNQKTANEFNNIGQITILAEDLPLSCPLPGQEVWNAHPRVYLPIVQTGKAICPYCSAKYVLKGKKREDIPEFSDESLNIGVTDKIERTRVLDASKKATKKGK